MKFVTLLATHLETWPFATDVALGYSDGWLYICHPYTSTVGMPALPPPPLPSPSGVLQSKAWTSWKVVVVNDFQLPAGLPIPDPNESLVTDWKQWKEEVLRLAALADGDTTSEPATVVNLTDPMSIKKCIHELQAQIGSLHAQMNAKKDLCSSYHRALAELGFSLNKSSVQPPM